MTSEHNGRDHRLEDELYVDALLAASGFPAGSADDGGLRDTLLRLRSLRGAEVPEPCAELVALMGADCPALADVIPLEGRARRPPRKRRAVFTSLTVAASLGIAGGAAAGNETVRRHAEGTIDTIVRSFSPPVPTPAPAAGAPKPATDVVPSPLWTVPPALDPLAAVGAPGPGQGGQKPSRNTALTTPAPDPTPPANRKPNGPRETPATQTPSGPQETSAGPPPPGNPAEGPALAGEKDKEKAGSDRAPALPGDTRSR